MGGAETRNEMVFKGLDCSFGPVASVQACRGELVLNVLVGDEFLEKFGGFIVEAMETWLEAASLEQTKYFGIGRFDRVFLGMASALIVLLS